MKSWALTAFAALALTASHGVHAAPKGRSLSAMSRILGLAKNHPKTSILLGVLGALSSYALYMRATAEKRRLIRRIDRTLNGKNLNGEKNILDPLRNLKKAVKSQINLSKKAMAAMLRAAICIDSIQGKKYVNLGFFPENAAYSVKELTEAIKHGAPKEETNTLIDAIKTLMKKELDDALFQTKKIFKTKNEKVTDALLSSFEGFKTYCKSIDIRDVRDIRNVIHMSSAIGAIKYLNKFLSEESALNTANLCSAIQKLGGIQGNKAARALIKELRSFSMFPISLIKELNRIENSVSQKPLSTTTPRHLISQRKREPMRSNRANTSVGAKIRLCSVARGCRPLRQSAYAHTSLLNL